MLPQSVKMAACCLCQGDDSLAFSVTVTSHWKLACGTFCGGKNLEILHEILFDAEPYRKLYSYDLTKTMDFFLQIPPNDSSISSSSNN